MRIQVGKYVIKSDTHCFVTGEPYTYIRKHKGSETPEEGLRDPSYHATLSQALTALLNRSLRESDIRALGAVRQHVDDFKKEIAELSELEVE